MFFGEKSGTVSKVCRMDYWQATHSKYTGNFTLPPSSLQSLQVGCGLHFWGPSHISPPKVLSVLSLEKTDAVIRLYEMAQEQASQTKITSKLHLGRSPQTDTESKTNISPMIAVSPKSPKASSEGQKGRYIQSFDRAKVQKERRMKVHPWQQQEICILACKVQRVVVQQGKVGLKEFKFCCVTSDQYN